MEKNKDSGDLGAGEKVAGARGRGQKKKKWMPEAGCLQK